MWVISYKLKVLLIGISGHMSGRQSHEMSRVDQHGWRPNIHHIDQTSGGEGHISKET